MAALENFQAFAFRAALTDVLEYMPASARAERAAQAAEGCALIQRATSTKGVALLEPFCHVRHWRSFRRLCDSQEGIWRGKAVALDTPAILEIQVFTLPAKLTTVQTSAGIGHAGRAWRSGGPLPRVTFAIRRRPAKRAITNDEEIIKAIE